MTRCEHCVNCKTAPDDRLRCRAGRWGDQMIAADTITAAILTDCPEFDRAVDWPIDREKKQSSTHRNAEAVALFELGFLGTEVARIFGIRPAVLRDAAWRKRKAVGGE